LEPAAHRDRERRGSIASRYTDVVFSIPADTSWKTPKGLPIHPVDFGKYLATNQD